MVVLNIANTVKDLIQGDLKEHLPFERIPLEGDVLGLGTTTSVDNGELAFLHAPAENRTRIYNCRAIDGSLRELRAGDGSGHFPFVCFTGDAGRACHPIDLARLPSMESIRAVSSPAT